MPLPNAFTGISGNSPYLSDDDIPKQQPVQVVQPVQQYYAMQSYAATPQPQQQKNYVFLPLKYDPKKAGSTVGTLLFMERNSVIESFTKAMNEAGVAWVDTNTGKDNNGVQVLQPVTIPDEVYKKADKGLSAEDE
ncbi:hypothetical protein LNM54_004233 [Salmonella enterica subsp. enterica]|nr:hypothetical protein [Salmonella enterica subsp. enterica]